MGDANNNQDYAEIYFDDSEKDCLKHMQDSTISIFSMTSVYLAQAVDPNL